MPFLDKIQVLQRFKSDGRNSSHFVWLLADLRFYECANRWVFAFYQRGGVTLLALEPLIPGAPTEYTAVHEQQFRDAWAEFSRASAVKLAAFVSVYDAFANLLKAAGFKAVKVGQEPWIDLTDCIPTGNAGKGVRSARNQALLAGLTVEEWRAADIATEPKKLAVMRESYAEWKSKHVVNLSGYMNTTTPFERMEERRYFVLRSPRRGEHDIEGFLVATPVPGIESYFLEDLILRNQSPRGSGELLTLETMVALRDAGHRQASLGVISVTTIDTSTAEDLPLFIKFLMITLPRYLATLYNFNGLSVYRKRFKPHSWQNISLAVKDEHGPADTGAWMRVLVTLLLAFRPRLNLTWRWFADKLLGPFINYPVTAFSGLFALAAFAFVNQFRALPEWALSRFGFFSQAPLVQWFHRSVVSDFLYFDRSHFLSCALPLAAMIYWAERSHRRSFFVPFILGCFLFDDFVNYLILIRPFQFFHPDIFSHMVAYKDVGGSLVLSLLVGMQICQFRVLREPLFAGTMLFGVLGFAFAARQLEWLLINLNHPILFVMGFFAGKLRFEYLRRRSQLASKGKPPVAKSALPTKKVA